jgi:hypothetical protein
VEGHVPIWLEITSYVASALVFLSFFMKEIVPLRLIAIVSNIFFMIYAIGAGLLPILILDAALLPLNIWRVIEYKRLERKVRAASQGTVEVEKIVPLMTGRRVDEGEVLFRKGDAAEELYYLAEGRIRFEEVDVEIGPGTVFGEVGVFLDDEGRTATATCVEGGEIRTLSRKRVEQLVMVDPGFGLFLTRLIAARLTANMAGMSRA